MHPYVKHHLHQLVIVLFIFTMIINLSATSSTCLHNFPVRKIRLYSNYAKGYVIANKSRVEIDQGHGNFVEERWLYQVTIDRHYFLLYHFKTKRFICWNRHFNRLVARTNPNSLTYCKFEETPSKISAHQRYDVRYTTRDNKGREIEIRFSKNGAFARQKYIKQCVTKTLHRHKASHKLDERLKLWKEADFLRLNPAKIQMHSEEQAAYQFLVQNCASPDFLVTPATSEGCDKYEKEFCAQMDVERIKGHMISSEIIELCNKGRNN